MQDGGFSIGEFSGHVTRISPNTIRKKPVWYLKKKTREKIKKHENTVKLAENSTKFWKAQDGVVFP